jgi:hypothetical protein
MPRLARWLLNALTVLSLLLCVAVVGFWVRSYSWLDEVDSWGADSHLSLISHDGSLTVERQNVGSTVHPNWRWTSFSPPPKWALATSWFAGFGRRDVTVTIRDLTITRRVRITDTAVPYWVPVVLAASLPSLRLHLARRRTRPGFCRRCRYDLTANVSGVCPECGTAVRNERPA